MVRLVRCRSPAYTRAFASNLFSCHVTYRAEYLGGGKCSDSSHTAVAMRAMALGPTARILLLQLVADGDMVVLHTQHIPTASAALYACTKHSKQAHLDGIGLGLDLRWQAGMPLQDLACMAT